MNDLDSTRWWHIFLRLSLVIEQPCENRNKHVYEGANYVILYIPQQHI